MSSDYCPYCRRVTPQIKDGREKLCKRCGKISKRLYGRGSVVDFRPLTRMAVTGATIGLGIGLFGAAKNAFK